MTTQLAAIALSIPLAWLILHIFRKFDQHNAEPTWIMILATMIGGFVSVAISLLAYYWLEPFGISQEKLGYGYMVYVGLIEEAGKFLAFLLIFNIFEKHFDEPIDYIIYIGLVAIGFSIIENYLYATKDNDSFNLLFLRSMISSPIHVLFSIYMGLAFYKYKTKLEASILTVLNGFFIAAMLHALWNITAMMAGLLYFFMVLAAWLLYRAKIIFAFLLINNDLRPRLAHDLHETNTIELKQSINCLNCAAKIETAIPLKVGRIMACQKCETYNCQRQTLYNIFRYYANQQGNLSKAYNFTGQKSEFCLGEVYSIYYCNTICHKTGRAYFKLSNVEQKIADLESETIDQYYNLWVKV